MRESIGQSREITPEDAALMKLEILADSLVESGIPEPMIVERLRLIAQDIEDRMLGIDNPDLMEQFGDD